MKTDITLSIALEDVAKLSAFIKAFDCRLKAAENALARERKGFDDYRSAESERLANERKLREAVFAKRVSVLNNNERKNAVYSEYLNAMAQIINEAWEFIRPKVGRVSKTKMLDYIERLNSEWERFDKMQKECAK